MSNQQQSAGVKALIEKYEGSYSACKRHVVKFGESLHQRFKMRIYTGLLADLRSLAPETFRTDRMNERALSMELAMIHPPAAETNEPERGEVAIWHNVNEGDLPEKRIRVNTWDGLIVHDCYLDIDNIWKETSSEEPCRYPITHWMPLPDEPDTLRPAPAADASQEREPDKKTAL